MIKKKNCKKKCCDFRGISEKLIRRISSDKNEPEWMLNKRLKALELYKKTSKPNWGPDLSKLDLDNLCYYVAPQIDEKKSWEKVPMQIKNTFDDLGVIEAEKDFFSGVGAQYDSNIVYHNLKQEWRDKGIIFENMDKAVKKYPELVKEYFMTKCVPINMHKFSMLHAAVWSGGTFIYVPKGVKIDIPLQAYFRMNQKKGGQFEHTLIIADEGSEVHYIEGCSATEYGRSALHAGCVELFVKKGAKIVYSSIENWSRDMYNLNTKRAIVEDDGTVEWTSGNMGSNTTMLYPASVLVGKNSKSINFGVVMASSNQNQDIGAKVYHIGDNSTSTIHSKSISKNGGISTYRGLVSVNKDTKGVKSSIECDALILDDKSISNTYPLMDVKNKNATIIHEAKVGKISEKEIFYLMSKGLSEIEAKNMIVNGFLNPIVKKFPLEYAVELNKLIDLEIEGGF